MVTLIKYGALSGGEKYNVNVLSLDGLSTDTKPIGIFIEYGSDGREVGRMGIPNGSIFTEIDTGDTYMYDADNTTWYQVTIGCGGGGGGGFTPTTAQLNAMNSGINSTKVAQITTNESNISSFVTPIVGNITPNESLASAPVAQTKLIVQSGKTVTIQLYVDLVTAITSDTNTVIGTLTGVSPPKLAYRGMCAVASQYYSSDFNTCFVGVSTDNELYLRPRTGTTNTKYLINITYQTN